MKKLLNTEEYSDFADRVSEEYFSSEFFKGFCNADTNEELMLDFMSDVSIGVYRRWEKKPDGSKPDLDRLADMTAHMLLGGLNGLG